MPRLSQWTVLTLLVLGLGWSSTVSAQVRPAPNPPPPRPTATSSSPAPAATATEAPGYPSYPPTSLLSMPSVQDELRMTAAQKQQFRTMNDQFNQANQPDMMAANQLQEGQEAKFNELNQRMFQRFRIFERQVQQLLQPLQWAQLQQIAFRMSVTQALQIPQIAERIRLTPEQKQRVQQIHAASADKFYQVQRQVAEQLLQSLSPPQQQALQSLNAQAAQGGPR